jgi:hypothetical protein
MMRRSSHLRSLSLRVRVFTPKHSRKTSTPWSVFQDGSLVTITPASLQSADLGPPRGIARRAITLPEEPHSRGLYPPGGNRCWPGPGEVHQRFRWVIRAAQVWSQALPFQQFHVLFDPLFKVLFIFRSLYLCAIGLWPVFSFRRNLPPI